MEQIEFTELSPEDKQIMEETRNQIRRRVPERIRAEFDTAAGRLAAAQDIFSSGQWRMTHDLITVMGILLGDSMNYELGSEWAMVYDDHGKTWGIKLVGMEIAIYPVSMVQRRIEREEQINFVETHQNICLRVRSLVAGYQEEDQGGGDGQEGQEGQEPAAEEAYPQEYQQEGHPEGGDHQG